MYKNYKCNDNMNYNHGMYDNCERYEREAQRQAHEANRLKEEADYVKCEAECMEKKAEELFKEALATWEKSDELWVKHDKMTEEAMRLQQESIMNLKKYIKCEEDGDSNDGCGGNHHHKPDCGGRDHGCNCGNHKGCKY